MSKVIHIVDYGVGNLYSAQRAVAKAGGEARLSNDPAEIANAERLLLPGVGAFASCVGTLRSSGLVEPIRDFLATGRPFMGICVGMQLLFDYSLEFGHHPGLGLIPGHVERIPAGGETDGDGGGDTSGNGGTRKVPHIGWSPLSMPGTRASWDGTVLAGMVPGDIAAYFVHSYNCVPDDPDYLLATADYDGFTITAAIQRDNITAFQCHPEKSGPVGLKIVEQFLAG